MSDFVTVAWVAAAYFQPECPDTLHLDDLLFARGAFIIQLLNRAPYSKQTKLV